MLLLFFASCVSQSEYDAVKKENEELRERIKNLGLDQKQLPDNVLSEFLSQNLASQKEIEDKNQSLKNIREAYEQRQKDGDGGVDKDITTFEHDPDRGNLFRSADLQPGIDEYEAWRIPMNEVSRNYFPKYFFFGKNKLKKLIDQVGDYKPPGTGREFQIAGYLVKLAFKRDRTYPINRLDAILVPVRYDGTPVFEMSLKTKQNTFGSGLDESGPCPDECP